MPKECSTINLEPNKLYVVPQNPNWIIYFDQYIIDNSNFGTRKRTITLNGSVIKVKKISFSCYCNSKDIKFPLKLKSGDQIKFSEISLDGQEYTQEQSINACEMKK